MDLRSQDIASFDEKLEEVEKPMNRDKLEVPCLQMSAEELRKKSSRRDEDPKITKFKNTEVKFFFKFKF